MSEAVLHNIIEILDFVIFLLVLKYSFGFSISKKRALIIMSFSGIGFAICNALSILGESDGLFDSFERFGLYLLFFVIFGWAYAYAAIKGNKKQILITTVFYIGILISFCVFRTALKKLVLLYTHEEVIWMVYLFQYLLLGVTAFIFTKLTKPIYHKLSNLYWIIAGVTPILMILILDLMNRIADIGHWEAIIVPGLAIVSLMCTYFLFIRLAIELENQMELDLANQSMAFQIRQMESETALLENTRRARHELKNNYFYIESLLEEAKYEEIKEFISEKVNTELEKNETVATGNRFVDMVLTHKLQEAKQKGVPIIIKVILPEKIVTDQQMLCGLLSNLIDNAIEASLKEKDPGIVCTMNIRKGYLFIEVKNKISQSVLKSNPGLKTDKKDHENHGIGLKLVRQIVKQSDGDIQISEADGYFVVSVLMPER